MNRYEKCTGDSGLARDAGDKVCQIDSSAALARTSYRRPRRFLRLGLGFSVTRQALKGRTQGRVGDALGRCLNGLGGIN